MSTSLMIHSTCFGLIQIEPRETVLWPAKVTRVREPKSHNLLSPFKQIIYLLNMLHLFPLIPKHVTIENIFQIKNERGASGFIFPKTALCK